MSSSFEEPIIPVPVPGWKCGRCKDTVRGVPNADPPPKPADEGCPGDPVNGFPPGMHAWQPFVVNQG